MHNQTDPTPIDALVDALFHTQEHPFCLIDSCFCHEDPDLIAAVAELVTEGLFTPEEALRFVEGRIV